MPDAFPGEPPTSDVDFSSPELLARERAAMFEQFRDFPFFKLLGIDLLEADPHRSRLAMNWRPDLTQPAGIMHGGVIATLVDTAIAHAIQLTPAYLELKPRGGMLVSVDLRIKYLRPVSAGRIFCEARVPRVGKHIIHAVATVTNEADKEVATGDSMYMLITREQIRKK